MLDEDRLDHGSTSREILSAGFLYGEPSGRIRLPLRRDRGDKGQEADGPSPGVVEGFGRGEALREKLSPMSSLGAPGGN